MKSLKIVTPRTDRTAVEAHDANEAESVKWFNGLATIEKALITPERAQYLLTRNLRNRPIYSRKLRQYTALMKTGEWRFIGDTAAFDTANVLLNGQHRLQACVNSGRPFEVIVVKGLPTDTFEYIDSGLKRTGPDTLSVIGENYPKVLAPAVRLAWVYYGKKLPSNDHPTNKTLVEALGAHPNVRSSVQWAVKQKKIVGFSESWIAGCHYIFSNIDQEQAEDFLSRVILGINLKAHNDPAYVAREKLLNNALSKAHYPGIFLFACVIKAWNAFRRGEKITKLDYRYRESDGSQPEQFPIAI